MKKKNNLEKHLYRTVSYRIDYMLPSVEKVDKANKYAFKLVCENDIKIEWSGIGICWYPYVIFSGDNEIKVKETAIKFIKYLKKFKDAQIDLV